MDFLPPLPEADFGRFQVIVGFGISPALVRQCIEYFLVRSLFLGPKKQFPQFKTGDVHARGSLQQGRILPFGLIMGPMDP